tara:strand:- start:1473 stop:1718 length:246 start_codon:yes stop_codon:yes gene_type:complete
MELNTFEKDRVINNSFEKTVSISLETELSESLYRNMKDFVLKNPKWDQYQLINSAIANFLVQNGCGDSKVTEIYLDQIFNP